MRDVFDKWLQREKNLNIKISWHGFVPPLSQECFNQNPLLYFYRLFVTADERPMPLYIEVKWMLKLL